MKKCLFTFVYIITRRHSTLFLLLFLLPLLTAQAQKLNITGKVTEGKEVIPGVSVRVKGTNQGTLTNNEGKFTLSAAIGDTLIFNHISYTPYQQAIATAAPLNVSL